MKKIILDCDNTMGVKNCDVDDAMALFYLLGNDDAEIVAITNTYGNSDIETVHKATQTLLNDIGRKDIPLYKGSNSTKNNIAGKMLAELAEKHKGELSVLAVGSTTNLASALDYDDNFAKNIKQVVFMGGITEKLIVGKKEMKELNLSIDYISTLKILQKAQNISIITGNNCLKTIFTRKEFEENLNFTSQGKYIIEKTKYWFDYNERDYGLQGFYNWDITAAIYLMKPELFVDDKGHYALCEEDMKFGKLRQGEGGVILNLPKIKNVEEFKKEAYEKLRLSK